MRRGERAEEEGRCRVLELVEWGAWRGSLCDELAEAGLELVLVGVAHLAAHDPKQQLQQS